MADEERQRLRAYWEDYLEYPGRINVDDAAIIEQCIGEVGVRLFRAVFSAPSTHGLWNDVRGSLEQTRIEIELDRNSQAGDIPWEYLRDPASNTFVSSSAAGFVRRPIGRDRDSTFDAYDDGPVRVLLVTSRPPCSPRFAFRPTARRLSHAVSEKEHPTVAVDLLRPPTIGQLSNVLMEVEATGQPYHVVQIDSHAYLLDPNEDSTAQDLQFGEKVPRYVRKLAGKHGYLPFDDPTGASSTHLLDGESLGDLLQEARVPLLVLNARRAADSTGGALGSSPVEAFDSFVQTVMSRGVAAALSIPSCVDTAGCTQFLFNVYANLARGAPLGEVATAGRQWLRSHPGPKKRASPFIAWDLAARKWHREPTKRDVVEGLVREQDWLTPIVYEAEVTRLTDAPKAIPQAVQARRPRTKQPSDHGLPNAAIPDLYGQEDTLVEIDRAWETNSVVLLHGPMGCGKTAVAVEYATWYREAIEGARVIYTSFADYRTLEKVAAEMRDFLGASDSEGVEPNWARDPYSGLPWLMNQGPLLWVWDHVERLSGSESKAGVLWGEDERDLFLEVLELAQQTTADVLLLSRDSERYWLGETALRIEVQPLPVRQGLQLVQGALSGEGRLMQRATDWLSLAHFAEGNPAVLRCLTAQAIREGVETDTEIADLVERARSTSLRPPRGGAEISESLCSAIGYVLKKSFSSGDRKLLSLLSLFQGVVSRELLVSMAGRNGILGLPELRALSEYQGLEQGADDNVLERAARLGLLSKTEQGAYEIPSVVTPFLKSLFRSYYSDSPEAQHSLWESATPLVDNHALPDSAVDGVRGSIGQRRMVKKMINGSNTPDQSSRPAKKGRNNGIDRAKRAYLEVMGRFGSMSARSIQSGRSEGLPLLATQESNLLKACRLAVAEERWMMAAGAVEGLCATYRQSECVQQWEVLLRPLLPLCAEDNPKNANATGRAVLWRTLMGQSALLAQRRQRLTQARNYQQLCVEWDRRLVVEGASEESVDGEEALDPHRGLADSLYRLSDILRDQGAHSVQLDEEAVTLMEELGETSGAANWSMELGRSYAGLPEGRGLNQAERWLKRALQLIGDDDQEGKAHCLAELGRTAWLQFIETRRALGTEQDLRRHLNRARRYYQRALEFDREDDFPSLAQHHKALGHVSIAMGDVHFALPHYRESIRYDDLSGSRRRAATTRLELAIDLRNVRRLPEALDHARAAFDQLSALGEDSDGVLMRARLLLEELETNTRQARRAVAAVKAR